MPLPSEALLRGTVRRTAAPRRHTIEFGIGGLHAVREDRMAAGQAVTLVDREVIGIARKEARNFLHFGPRFVEVSLKADAGIFAQQRAADFEHRIRAGKGKARRHRVEHPSGAVEFADKTRAFAVGMVRRLVERGAQEAVGQHHAGDDAQAGGIRRLEERRGGGGEMRAEDQRRRGAVRGERFDKFGGDDARVVEIDEFLFLGQGEALQPLEQAIAETAEDADLRIVDVGIDETGQQDAAAQVAYFGIGVCLANRSVVAAGGDAAHR